MKENSGNGCRLSRRSVRERGRLLREGIGSGVVDGLYKIIKRAGARRGFFGVPAPFSFPNDFLPSLPICL